MSSAIDNPSVPYVGGIPNGLNPGKLISIQGFIPKQADRFSVDLCRGTDIILHVNPRFEASCIVRNSFSGGSWANEEREPTGLGGLQRGSKFQMIILTETTHYRIAILGRHFADFAHRMPFQNVQEIQIKGDVQLYRIEYKTDYTSPSCHTRRGSPLSAHPSGQVASGFSKHRPVYNPPMPLNYRISGGVKPRMNILISGRPTNHARRFNINLCSNCGIYSSGDIPFHFGVRFDESCVVRNSRTNDNWGLEERGGSFPFQAGVNFDLLLIVFPNRFEIRINGQYFGTFTHRLLPPKRANTLEATDDVVINSVRFS